MSKKNTGTKIIQHEIHDEMKNSYIDYAMSVIVGRALPDVRDGLKPVHRRILYGMSDLGVTPDKPHKKSARIVGEVMGKYHPHGDSSIYDAMVRLAQDFSTRYMLVDGHGNFGSVDGDGAAAMRYTEARMTPFALEMLKDIEKETVDFMPNFDEEEQEPVVLPSRFPNLLVNGSNGIAVGMATSIPPHNLGEVIKAAVKLIENEDTSVDDLAKIVKGPDFPTGATIMGKGKIRDAYRTGQGKILVRSKVEIEKASRGREQIVVTEIPYQVNKAKLIEKIADLVKDKKLEGITDIRDESNREGTRVVIELKREVNAQIVLNRLYKQTSLQESFSIIMLALVNGEPRICNLKELLVEYLKHQKDVVTRRTKYDLKKAEARAHILEGLRIALDNIDEIIRIIRKSYNDAKMKLMQAFQLSDVQTQAILDMRLARLQGLEREKIEEEYQELMEKIAYYKQLLGDEALLMNVIKEELEELRKRYGDKRRTAIVAEAEEIEEKDLIVEEEVEITLSYKGFVRNIPAGSSPQAAKEDDFVRRRAFGSTHDQLLFFTNTGKAHALKIFDVPKTHRMGKGTPLNGLISLMQRERVTAMVSVKSFAEERYLLMVTKKGNIKKIDLRQFSSSRKGGVAAIGLKEGDELTGVKELNGKSAVIIVTKQGKCISFSEADVNPTGRTAAGVRAIQLGKGDEIVSMELSTSGEELCIITEKGYGKRSAAKDFRTQIRGGKGLFAYEKGKLKNHGEIAGMMTVSEQSLVLLVTSEGAVAQIAAAAIPQLSRTAPGDLVLELDQETAVVAVGKAAVGKKGDGPTVLQAAEREELQAEPDGMPRLAGEAKAAEPKGPVDKKQSDEPEEDGEVEPEGQISLF